MKTNRAAHWIVRIKGAFLGLALVGMAGVAFTFGEFAAARSAQATAFQTGCDQAPNISLGDLLDAMH
jgi:hypothetical protein